MSEARNRRPQDPDDASTSSAGRRRFPPWLIAVAAFLLVLVAFGYMLAVSMYGSGDNSGPPGKSMGPADGAVPTVVQVQT